MTKLSWDAPGEKSFETGVDRGVLYRRNPAGAYNKGYAWLGLVSVSESPSGAESNKQYADNRVYANLISAEEFSATLEAFTYPDEFEACDGSAELGTGISIGQQKRESFGLAYRTLVGNDLNSEAGYKLHLVYGGMAAPTEKAHNTVNDSPELETFSWEISTTPVNVPGHKPTATLTIDSTKVDATRLAAFEDILYGTAGADARMPTPTEVADFFEGSVTVATPVAPTYNAATKTITIPATPGVVYTIDGEPVTGAVVITEDTIVTAIPAEDRTFPPNVDTDWGYDVP